MNFIDDDCLNCAEDFAAFCAGEQEVERFGGGDQNLRRAAQHGGALGGRSVACAHQGANWQRLAAGSERHLLQFGQGHFQIAMDVVGQCFERRDIDHAHSVGERAIDCLAQEPVERSKKRRQRFTAAGRGGDQGMAAGRDFRPAARLRLGWLAEAIAEPGFDEGVEHDYLVTTDKH